MDYQIQLRKPQFQKKRFYGLYSLFLFNDQILGSSRLEKWIWDRLKCELFYIQGQCQHSGNCCKYLMLVRRGKPIDSVEVFEKESKKHAYYSFFNPVKEFNKILHFSCSLLKADNTCSQYATRPQFCRDYPYSSFLQLDFIPHDCGYKVARKETWPSLGNNFRFNQFVTRMEALNHL